MARGTEPAITPVPGPAGLSITRLVPWAPSTSWGMVPFSSMGTLIRLRRATYWPFCTATGTSLALPSPTPTLPLRSPMTTIAPKRKRRPPWYVLAVRRMKITLSSNHCLPSELQASLTCAVSERLDAAVEAVAATVAHDALDTFGKGSLGQRFTDRCGLLLLVTTELERDAAGTGHGVASVVVDDLCVDVLVGAEHAEPKPAGIDLAPDLATAAERAPLAGSRVMLHSVSLLRVSVPLPCRP